MLFGLPQFDLFAAHYSGPVAVSYAVRHPDRVRRLVLYGTYATGWKHRGLKQDYLDEWDAIIKLTRSGFGRDDSTFSRMYIDFLAPGASEEQVKWFLQLCRMAVTADAAAMFIGQAGESLVDDLLPKVTAPTLVVHAQRDTRIPFEWGRRLAAGIPNSKFVSLDSDNHVLLEDEPAWEDFQREFRAFLQ